MRVRGSVRGALKTLGCLALVVFLSMCTHDASTLTGPAAQSAKQVPVASLATVVPVSGNSVIAGGNIATCSGNDDEKTAGILDTVPGPIVTTGNAAYPNGTDSAYTNCFAVSTTWGRHKVRILPAPGDQDYNTTNATGYYNYFGAAAGDPTKGYYSYDIGAWHVLALNSSLAMTAGSAQEQWIRADLAASGKPCTLAYWQLPLYSSGQSGSFTKVRPVWQALYDFGVDVVLNGKDRDYERFDLQDPNGNLDLVKGIREFVVGAGGAGNSSSFRTTILPNSQVRYLTASGLLKLTLNATNYSWLFIPVKGAVPDSGTTTCSGGNRAPVANAGGPYAGPEATAVTFNGAGSSDADNDPLSYDWNFGDGSAHGTSVAPTHTYADNGTYTVTLTASDGHGGTTAATTTATISNVAPTATFDAPTTIVEGGSIGLSLLNPTDPSTADANIGFTYAFDCGLGTGYGAFGSTSSTSCLVADNGSRTVKGEVRDKDGGVTEYTASVTITNAAPVISVVTAPVPTVNLGAALQVQAAFSDIGVLDTHNSSIDWGDGTTAAGSVSETNGSGSTNGTHTYTRNGVFTVRVTVTDKDGGSDTESTQVTVNGAPTITGTNGPYVGNEGALLTLTVTATDPESDPVGYDWDFGDGSPHGTGASVTHVYADNGSYAVTVVASDSHGAASAPTTTSATIANVSPTATYNLPTAAVNEGGAFTLALTSPVDPSAADQTAQFAYAFDCGDGAGYGPYTSATTRSCPTTDNGSRATRASIKDKDGGSTEYTGSVTVTNVAPTVGALQDAIATLGSDVAISATFSDPGTSDGPWSYHIAWGDGSADDGSTSTQSGPITATHRYASGGVYTVAVEVKDKDAASGSGSLHATVNTPPTIASDGGPYSANEGATVSFTATANDADGDGLTYDWDFGDGSAHGTAAASTHKYPDNGTHSVTLVVTDGRGASTTATTSATIANVAPAAGPVTGAGAQSPLNVPVSVSVNFTDAGTLDTHTSTIDWGDGTTAPATVNESNGGGTAGGSHSYPVQGSYTIQVTVTDKDGGSNSSTHAITIVDPVNRAPTAMTGGPYASNEGGSIAFDGSASSDPDGDAITYDWDFGDGSPHASGVRPSHTYGDNGSYTVTLVVTDSKGLSGTSTTTTATVANLAPTATFDVPANSFTEGSSFTLSLSSPVDVAADAGSLQYSFDCGSGAGFTALSSASSATCATTDNATLAVKAKIRDKDGGVSNYTGSVTVTNATPVVGALNGPAGSPPALSSVSVDGAFSDAGVGDTHTASISWGDGNNSVASVSESAGSGSASGSHTYAAQGTYTVRLTVTDKDGGVGFNTIVVTIAPPVNHPPTAVVNGPYSGTEGTAIAFSATGSSDPDGDTITYDWNFGDGSAHGAGAAPNHTYADNGVYSVTLTVIDGKGLGSSPSTSTATVSNVAPTATFNAPASLVEGSSITLSLTGVVDPSTADGTAGFQYAFDCGAGAGYGAFGSASSTTCSTSDNGSRAVRGKAMDKDGGVSEYTLPVSVTNAAPIVASATGPSSSVNIGVTVSVSSSFTDVGTADTHTVSYGWGDGSTTTGSVSESNGAGTTSGSHAYTGPGSYTVTVTVTDKDGASGSKTTLVTVVNGTPAAVVGGPYTGSEASAVSFDGSASTDPDNDVLTYDWNFGDGAAHGSGIRPTHTYTDNGTYTVTLIVTDSRGAASPASTTTATIANVAPTATFNAPASVNEGSTIAISLSTPRDASSIDVVAGFTYAFDCGAGAGYGAFASGTNANCPTTDNASRTVKGKIKDKDGGVTEYTATTVVQNVAPTVGALSGPSGSVALNTPVSVSATFTDPATVDTHTASIIWGDGATTAGSVTETNGSGSASGTHTFTATGTFTVRLTVTDKDGGSNFSTKSITVTPPSTSQTLVGAGDIVRCSLTNAEATARIIDTIPGTVFVAGDNAYENGTLTEYQSCYGATWGRFFSRTKPAAGNHEYNTPGATGYYQYFGALAGDPSKGYYSYDLGAWHIVVLNSNISTTATSAQVAWLRSDLAANTKTCTLAYWHHPRFNSGPVGNNSGMKPLWDALYDFGAEVVISAHEHLYERFAPQTPAGAADPARGIRQFTVGTGGAGNVSKFGATQPNSQARYLDDFGVLKLTLFDGGYSWNFITVSKGYSDSGTGSCH